MAARSTVVKASDPHRHDGARDAGTELRNVAAVSAVGPELSLVNNTNDASVVVNRSITSVTTPTTPTTTPVPTDTPTAVVVGRPAPLPATGADIGGRLRTVFVLIGVGALAMALGRRRSSIEPQR